MVALREVPNAGGTILTHQNRQKKTQKMNGTGRLTGDVWSFNEFSFESAKEVGIDMVLVSGVEPA